MPLQSVLQTALSGISAATATFDAVGHNVANLRTNGYKAARPTFATQTPATRSVGGEPTASQGGNNPLQIGTGVRLVGYETDRSPGSLVAARRTSAAWGNASESDGVVELSNVDLGDELVELFLGSNQFRANARVFGASSQLMDELVQLGRR
jgi:flagellar hook protein FlgE